MILNHAQEWGLSLIRDTPSDYIIGVDEVGLGAIAGPFVVCAAVFPKDWTHARVRDSKSFHGHNSKNKHRNRSKVLEEIIRPVLLHREIEVVPHDDIDALGLGVALEDAMRRVSLKCSLKYPGSILVIDGDRRPLLGSTRVTAAIPKGDALVPAISAASIIAKTTRDAMMFLQDELYPNYGFVDNVGYLTEEHQKALEEYGPCSIHRKSCAPVQRAMYRKPGL